MDHFATVHRLVKKYDRGQWLETDDVIAAEYPVTIRLNGEEFATMVCTPTDLEDLTIGFLAAEGIIRFADEIQSISIDESKGFVHVELFNRHPINKDSYSKRFIGSCCGKSRQFYFHNDMKTAKTVLHRHVFTVAQCVELMRMLQNASTDFLLTGGVHYAALCTCAQIVVSRSDIGRHNALDKVHGHWLKNKVSLRDKAILFSGRVSSEVLLKTAKIGVGILLSKSAPTDLALELADELGITVAGFIRGDKVNVYTHPERISNQ